MTEEKRIKNPLTGGEKGSKAERFDLIPVKYGSGQITLGYQNQKPTGRKHQWVFDFGSGLFDLANLTSALPHSLLDRKRSKNW